MNSLNSWAWKPYSNIVSNQDKFTFFVCYDLQNYNYEHVYKNQKNRLNIKQKFESLIMWRNCKKSAKIEGLVGHTDTRTVAEAKRGV